MYYIEVYHENNIKFIYFSINGSLHGDTQEWGYDKSHNGRGVFVYLVFSWHP